jgi:predicted DNA-binding transcriptional regulator AlpA
MDDLDSVRVLKRPDAIRVTGLSEDTFKRIEKSGDGPPKTRLSPGRIGYRVSDLKEWLDKRRERGAA